MKDDRDKNPDENPYHPFSVPEEGFSGSSVRSPAGKEIFASQFLAVVAFGLLVPLGFILSKPFWKSIGTEAEEFNDLFFLLLGIPLVILVLIGQLLLLIKVVRVLRTENRSKRLEKSDYSLASESISCNLIVLAAMVFTAMIAFLLHVETIFNFVSVFSSTVGSVVMLIQFGYLYKLAREVTQSMPK